MSANLGKCWKCQKSVYQLEGFRFGKPGAEQVTQFSHKSKKSTTPNLVSLSDRSVFVSIFIV
jgi:hypothetical protein